MKGALLFAKSSLRFYQLTRQEPENAATALFEVLASGAVKPIIGQRYRLADAARAQRSTPQSGALPDR